MEEQYFSTTLKHGHKVLIPCNSELQAIRVRFFQRSVNAIDQGRRSGPEYLLAGVECWTENEIAYALKYPEEMGYRTFRLGQRVHMHPSWRCWNQAARNFVFEESLRGTKWEARSARRETQTEEEAS